MNALLDQQSNRNRQFLGLLIFSCNQNAEERIRRLSRGGNVMI